MSGNYKITERIASKEGKVTDIRETPRGYYVIVEFDE